MFYIFGLKSTQFFHYKTFLVTSINHDKYQVYFIQKKK